MDYFYCCCYYAVLAIFYRYCVNACSRVLVAVAVVCTGLLLHEYVYPPLPSVATTVAVPFFSPKHATGVALSLPLLRLLVELLLPWPLLHSSCYLLLLRCKYLLPRLVAVAVVCTGLLLHEYVYPPLPSLATTVAVPFFSPKHATGVALSLPLLRLLVELLLLLLLLHSFCYLLLLLCKCLLQVLLLSPSFVLGYCSMSMCIHRYLRLLLLSLYRFSHRNTLLVSHCRYRY